MVILIIYFLYFADAKEFCDLKNPKIAAIINIGSTKYFITKFNNDKYEYWIYDNGDFTSDKLELINQLNECKFINLI